MITRFIELSYIIFTCCRQNLKMSYEYLLYILFSWSCSITILGPPYALMCHCMVTCIALDLEVVLSVYVLSRKPRNLLSMMPFLIILRWFSFFSSYSSTHKPLYYRPPRPCLSLLSLRDHLSYRLKWIAPCEWITMFPTLTTSQRPTCAAFYGYHKGIWYKNPR